MPLRQQQHKAFEQEALQSNKEIKEGTWGVGRAVCTHAQVLSLTPLFHETRWEETHSVPKGGSREKNMYIT